ncbi:hypothetical protein ElyMa_005608200 [Elysia marginata]|uniref:Uncharacterized protein n=1 Tax=Elysia marginata TaxID=1093978 RepID=A0AAV4F590_9GAST|nr:hypothetical protein ElyMa_005608200 [Elysia marginata]
MCSVSGNWPVNTSDIPPKFHRLLSCLGLVEVCCFTQQGPSQVSGDRLTHVTLCATPGQTRVSLSQSLEQRKHPRFRGSGDIVFSKAYPVMLETASLTQL